MNQNAMETLIGAVVIVIAVGFFVFAYTISGITMGQGGYRVSASFENIEGVTVGSDVRMSGIKIGTVYGQSLDPETYQAVVTLALDRSIRLPDDSSARITSEGLLGSRFITIEPGGSERMLEDGDMLIFTQSAVDIWSMIGRAIFDRASE